ncbi:MAG: hypothetical protein HOE90_02990 [Bacteriovoracaceae bacterium]|nr:hypothetical protein [Bacteriovoracaceae bacterium]
MLPLLLCSCLNSDNSAVLDYKKYEAIGGIQNTEADQRYKSALTVIKRKCLACHPSYVDLKYEADWIDSGYVRAGSLSLSSIYVVLKGAGIDANQEDMPEGSMLELSELNSIKVWIEGL